MPLTHPRHYSPEITEDDKTLSSREHTTEWVSYALIPDSVTLSEDPGMLIFEFDYPVREQPEESVRELESGAEVRTAESSKKLLEVRIPRDDRIEERLSRLPEEMKEFGSECELDSVERSYQIVGKFFEAMMDTILKDLHPNNGAY